MTHQWFQKKEAQKRDYFGVIRATARPLRHIGWSNEPLEVLGTLRTLLWLLIGEGWYWEGLGRSLLGDRKLTFLSNYHKSDFFGTSIGQNDIYLEWIIIFDSSFCMFLDKNIYSLDSGELGCAKPVVTLLWCHAPILRADGDWWNMRTRGSRS